MKVGTVRIHPTVVLPCGMGAHAVFGASVSMTLFYTPLITHPPSSPASYCTVYSLHVHIIFVYKPRVCCVLDKCCAALPTPHPPSRHITTSSLELLPLGHVILVHVAGSRP